MGGLAGFAFGLGAALLNGESGWSAIRAGLYAGASGFISAGGSVIWGVVVSGVLNAIDQGQRCGFKNINFSEVALNGVAAGLGGGAGRAFGKWKYPPDLYYPKRSKWNPKYWGEKLGMAKPLPPLDLNDFDRDVVTGAVGGLVEHGTNTARPGFGCEC